MYLFNTKHIKNSISKNVKVNLMSIIISLSYKIRDDFFYYACVFMKQIVCFSNVTLETQVYTQAVFLFSELC